MTATNPTIDAHTKAAFLAGYWSGTDVDELEQVKSIDWCINNHGECVGAKIMVDPAVYVSLRGTRGKLVYIDPYGQRHVREFDNVNLYHQVCAAGDAAMRELFGNTGD